MVHSKNKGAAGERELAKEVAWLFHCSARRGQQFAGGPDSPDIVTSLSGIHFECKRTEHFQLWSALEQATRDAGENVPVVCHRSNRHPWVVVVKLEDMPRLVHTLHPFIAQPQEISEHNNENDQSDTDQMRSLCPGTICH